MSDRPLGLRPQPGTPNRINSIAEFHRRMAMEPGGFKALNQAEIRRKIEAKQKGAHSHADDRDDGDEDDSDDSDSAMIDAAETTETSNQDEIIQIRDEIIKMAAEALHSASIMRDGVSLLLSKENPNSATTTLDPNTRQMVGLGTLGATRLAAPTTLTQERRPQNKMISIGRRLVDLNNAADSALAASNRLQKETDAETRYWSEVQTVTEAGFRIARLPDGQQHTMGVRFGFNSEKPDFADKDVAPIRRNNDGSAQLMLGPIGGGSQRIQVSVLENSTLVGRSSLPRPLPENPPLKDHVKEASETAFNQELWHEMNKEGRLMLNRNVHIGNGAITFPISPTETLSIRLVTLGEGDPPNSDSPRPRDEIAEAIKIAFALQLTSAHRFREEDEGENEMHTAMHLTRDEDEDEAEYLILEPIISYFEHENIIEQCVRLFSALIRPLRSAGLDSFVEVSEKSLKQALPSAKNHAVAATYALLTPPEVSFQLQITPQCRLGIKLRSSATEGTQFKVLCEPTSQPELANPLLRLCPPDPDGYDETSNLFEYLHDAVPRALAGLSGLIIKDLMSSSPSNDQSSTKWVYTPSNKGLVDSDTGDYGIHFEFPEETNVGRIVRLEGHFEENGQKISRNWTWPSADGQHSASSLEEAVRQVLAGCPGF